MKVLVTGASGFLGSHLARRLAEEGQEVVGLVRVSSQTSHLKNIRLVEGDILDQASLDRAIDGMEGCEAVFHAAAVLGFWKGVARAQETVNVAGTRLVCAAARRAGVRRLVHVSSVAAIGFPKEGTVGDEETPFTEEAARVAYARTKHEAEEEVVRATAEGLDAVIVNPAVIYGIRPNRHYAANLFEELAAGKVPAYPTGGCCWVGVDDVVEGLLLAWRKGRAGARYILGHENLPYRDFMRTVCRLAGSRPPRLPVPAPLARLAAWGMECRAARTGKHPLLSAESARLSGRHLYYSSDLARRELGYAPTPLASAAPKLLEELRCPGSP